MGVQPSDQCVIGQISRDIAPADKVFFVSRAVAHPMPNCHDQSAFCRGWFAIYLALLRQSQSGQRTKSQFFFEST